MRPSIVTAGADYNSRLFHQNACYHQGSLVRTFLIALAFTPIVAFGQTTAAASHGYGFAGVVGIPGSPFTRWDGTFVHLGLGGEKALSSHVGLGGELGLLLPAGNQFARNSGLLTGGLSYHFSGAGRRVDPFAGAGGGALVAGGAAGVLYGGGGVNYWARDRLGVRLEFRYHHWPHGDGPVRFIGFRAGVAFR